MAELDIAQGAAGLGLFGAAHRIARDAAAHVLVADAARHDRLAILGASRQRELLEERRSPCIPEIAVVLAFIVMGVDVDDQHVVEVALPRLLPGVTQELRGVELVDCDASAAVRNEVHRVVSSLSVYLFGATRTSAGRFEVPYTAAVKLV